MIQNEFWMCDNWITFKSWSCAVRALMTWRKATRSHSGGTWLKSSMFPPSFFFIFLLFAVPDVMWFSYNPIRSVPASPVWSAVALYGNHWTGDFTSNWSTERRVRLQCKKNDNRTAKQRTPCWNERNTLWQARLPVGREVTFYFTDNSDSVIRHVSR